MYTKTIKVVSHVTEQLDNIVEHLKSRVPLMECVLKTREVAKAIEEKDWDRVLELRGSSFKVSYFNWKSTKFSNPREGQ